MTMRNYSRQVPSNYYKFQSPTPRNYTQEKRLQQLHTLKETEVRVGIYKYSTEDELGKGYSSRVYKGVEIERLNHRYAIKVIQLKKFRGSSLQMLEAEIEIHRGLVHENVLRLHEVIKTPYFYYLILQYCPHGNLHEYVRQKKKLTQANALDIMEQILAGYRYLLEEGVIHRDLKPANILRVGNKWKISDFGFAVKSRYGFRDRINVGTPLYMPPESLKKSYYSSKSDIFALGIILFEMVTGRTPWECANQKQLLEKINTQLVIPQHVGNVSIREFIVRTCELNENRRMSREQLMEYQLKAASVSSSAVNKPPTVRESAVALTPRPNKMPSRKESICNTPSVPAPPRDDYIRHNTQVLAQQFLLVRHLHSCLKNIDSFLLASENRESFTLTLFKLLLRLVRFLCDRQTNCFALKNWLEYLSSQEYVCLYEKMLAHSQLLQKQYLQHIKHNDIKVIRSVNKRFPDLCHSAPLPEKFYQSLRDYMVAIIREHNHELMLIAAQEKTEGETVQDKSEKQEKPEKQDKQQKEEEKPQIPVDKEQKEEKEEKGGQLSAPRKIYESKRSIKLISSVQVGMDFLTNSQSENININPSQPITQPKSDSNILNVESTLQRKEEVPTTLTRQSSIKKQDTLPKSQTSVSLSLNDKIQALQSLYTIYRISDLRSQPGEKGMVQKITVIDNYSESTLQRRDYMDLRRLLRSI